MKKENKMAKLHIVGTALVAAALVAGCNKSENAATEPEKATTEPAAEEAKAPEAPAADEKKDPADVMISVGDAKITRGEIDAQVDEIVKIGRAHV